MSRFRFVDVPSNSLLTGQILPSIDEIRINLMEGLRVGLKGALRASLGEQVAVMVGLRGPDRPVYMAGDPRTPLGSVLGEKQATRGASTGSIVSVETPFGPGRGTIVMGHTCWYVHAKKRGEIRIRTDFLGFEIWSIYSLFLFVFFFFFVVIYRDYAWIVYRFCILFSRFFIL